LNHFRYKGINHTPIKFKYLNLYSLDVKFYLNKTDLWERPLGFCSLLQEQDFSQAKAPDVVIFNAREEKHNRWVPCRPAENVNLRLL
jgi:hypothetical protein